jgi:hypothetical protein
MGGINPCDRPGHAGQTGEHGERLTETIFGGFAAFLEAHRAVERAIIAETHRNDVAAVAQARDAQAHAAQSLDQLVQVREHLRVYVDELDQSEQFDSAVRRLEIRALRSDYVNAEMMSPESVHLDQMGAAVTGGGMRRGFQRLQELYAQVEHATREVVEQLRPIPALAEGMKLETSIRYGEFPFVAVNQRAMTRWQNLLTAYQGLCLLSLEAFASVNNSPRPTATS